MKKQWWICTSIFFLLMKGNVFFFSGWCKFYSYSDVPSSAGGSLIWTERRRSLYHEPVFKLNPGFLGMRSGAREPSHVLNRELFCTFDFAPEYLGTRSSFCFCIVHRTTASRRECYADRPIRSWGQWPLSSSLKTQQSLLGVTLWRTQLNYSSPSSILRVLVIIAWL
jgi:hypothetical protein